MGFYRNDPERFDKWLLFIVENQPSLNTCQICRYVNLAKINDIEKCRGKAIPITEFRKDSNFHTQGPYPNCWKCNYIYGFVWRRLKKLGERGKIFSRKEYRQDPQKPLGMRDNMRVYYPVGMIRTLKEFWDSANEIKDLGARRGRPKQG